MVQACNGHSISCVPLYDTLGALLISCIVWMLFFIHLITSMCLFRQIWDLDCQSMCSTCCLGRWLLSEVLVLIAFLELNRSKRGGVHHQACRDSNRICSGGKTFWGLYNRLETSIIQNCLLSSVSWKWVDLLLQGFKRLCDTVYGFFERACGLLVVSDFWAINAV